MIVSSKYGIATFVGISLSTILISLAYVAGPFAKPNGSLLNWNKPKGVANAVFSFDLFSRGITWKAPDPSSPEKIVEVDNLANESRIDYESPTDQTFGSDQEAVGFYQLKEKQINELKDEACIIGSTTKGKTIGRMSGYQ